MWEDLTHIKYIFSWRTCQALIEENLVARKVYNTQNLMELLDFRVLTPHMPYAIL